MMKYKKPTKKELKARLKARMQTEANTLCAGDIYNLVLEKLDNEPVIQRLTKRDAQKFLHRIMRTMLDEVSDQVYLGKRVRFRGFGTFMEKRLQPMRDKKGDIMRKGSRRMKFVAGVENVWVL